MDVVLTGGHGNSSAVSSLVEAVMRRADLRPGVPSRLAWPPATRLAPSDPTLDPYFALAEELDVPVGIHTGTSFPGTPFSGTPRFRVALGNPLLLEDLLVRRTRIRVFIMHGGEPWRRETIA